MTLTRNQVFVISRFLAEGMAAVAGFVTFPLISHNLGAESYGVAAFATTLTSVLLPVATLGLTFNVVRLYSGDINKDKLSTHFSSSLSLVLMWSIILSASLFLSAPLINHLFVKTDGAPFILRLSSVFVIVMSLELILNSYYRARLQINFFSVVQTLQSAGIIVISFVVLRLSGGLRELFIAWCIWRVLIVYTLISYFGRSGQVDFPAKLMPWNEQQRLIQLGLPIVVMGISTWVIGLGDRAVIGYFMNITDVGVYNAAYLLASSIGMLAAPFWGVMYPLLATHKNNDNLEGVYAVAKQYTSAYAFCALPISIVLTTLAPTLVRFFGTEEFKISPVLFGIIMVGLFIDQFIGPIYYLIYLHDDTVFLRNVMIFSAMFNLLVNVLFVPVWGILGAAIATMLTYVLLTSLLAKKLMTHGYTIRNLYNLKLLKHYMLALVLMGSVVIITLIVQPIDLPILLGAMLLGLATYGITILLIYRFNIPKILSFTQP